MGHRYGFRHPIPVREIGQIRSQVCVNRFVQVIDAQQHAHVQPLAQAIFTGELPGWHDMEELEQSHYRLLFERIVGAVNSTNANICANEIYTVFLRVEAERKKRTEAAIERRAGETSAASTGTRRPGTRRPRGTRRLTPRYDGGAVLWSIADRVIGRIYMDEREKIETQARQRYFQDYDRVIYVGRGLEDRVMLDRIFRLEYEPEFSPEEIDRAGTDGTVEMDGLVAELIANYEAMVERREDRAFERWKAQLNADTQIGVVAERARADVEKAKIEAAVRRYEADMDYKTELAKIRAQARARPGFFGKLLGAAAGVLGGGVARGVVDLVVPKPSPGGGVD